MMMWYKKILPYFQYSRKERLGMLVLLGVIAMLWVIPYFFADALKNAGDPDIAVVTAAVEQLTLKDSSSGFIKSKDHEERAPNSFRENRVKETVLFPFDPNEATEQEWMTLGLKPGTIRVIRNYLEKGGRFRAPKDLQRVYGLSNNDYNRLLPYVRINPGKSGKQYTDSGRRDSLSKRDYKGSRPPQKPVIDINQAGQAEWESLPGIGEKLAARILQFRNKLGGFHSVEQVKETYGISPELFAVISPMLRSEQNAGIRKMNINKAEWEELRQHPYIGYNLAKVLVAYRNQHGSFQTTGDLLNIGVFTPAILEKISPYVTLE